MYSSTQPEEGKSERGMLIMWPMAVICLIFFGIWAASGNSDNAEFRQNQLVQAEGGLARPGRDYHLGTIRFAGPEKCCWLHTNHDNELIRIGTRTLARIPWDLELASRDPSKPRAAKPLVIGKPIPPTYEEDLIQVTNGTRIWVDGPASTVASNDWYPSPREGVIADGPHQGKTVYFDERLIVF